ncbi:MAG: Sec-independent protein translocase TatA [Nitrospirae bacterium CG17_big_fil_post_rev_8_21_14_2_50_50_9]|nr:MAG: Sec-independent protein translocase TatA [Nitrospirae bacterium CG17_big_fil_post_rev_8_21_14_2_50_50_9]
MVIGFFALLLFGKRLPEVGRALGQSIVQFKKGIKGIEDEVESASTRSDHETPLKPYDKRLGGSEEELRRLQEQGAAPSQFKQERATSEPSA